MDFYKLLQSTENLLFELLMCLILFPLTIWTVLTHPRELPMIIRKELQEADEQRFDSYVSPPLALLLAVSIGALVSSDPPELANHTNQVGKLILGSAYNNLVFSALLFSTAPLAFTVIANLRNGITITRQSCRVGFYTHLWLIAPLAFLSPFFSVLAGKFGLAGIISGSLATAMLTLYYVWSVYRWYRTEAALGRGISIFAIITGGFIAMAVSFGVTLTLLDWSKLANG